MSLIKKINDPNGKKYDDVSIGALVLDTEPIPGSFNGVTSDAVVKAIDKAKDDMQEKIDEVTLDPSAVALGNVHLLDEVTEFPADGCILVDSETNGPGEMSKDTLLTLTAQNALGSIKSLDTTKYKGFMALDDADGTGKMDVDTIFNNFAPEFVPSDKPNPTTTIAGLPYMYNGSLYMAKEAYQGPWDASKFVSVSVKDLLNTIYYDYNTAILNIPVGNVPKISLSGNSYVITFPDTTSTGGVDANRLWIFSASKDTIEINYSSYIADGKFEVTLANNKALVYKISTGELLVKTIWNTEYKGDYFLIAANSSGVLYGPLSDYFVAERLDSDEKSIANIEKEIATPRTYQIWNNSGFLYGKGITNYGYPVATNPAFGNKYSDFIAVKKGDIIIANTCISNEGFAIAFYSSQDFSSLVSGVLGRDNTRLDKYIYICPSDGYISGSTSTYAYPDALNATIQIKTPSVKGESYESSSTPAYEFLNYNQLEKVGEVLTKGENGTFDDYMVESPSVWYDPNVEKLVMVYTAYRNESGTVLSSVGYAFSDDGINWTKQGRFYSPSGVADAPDENGITGPTMVFYGGKYYFFYIGLTGTGYEGGTKSLCLAVGTSIEDFTNNTATRKGAVIAPLGAVWTASWYANQVYHPTFVQKDGLWYCFFNSHGNPNNKERIGFAVAEKLEGPWNVNTKPLLDYIDESVISVAQIAIDPSVSKINDYFVLGYGFKVASVGKFCDCWAFTESDNFPYGWQYGGIGVKPSESGFDSSMAHKPFYLKHSGRMYHYYTAVGDLGHCIGLIR